MPKVEAFQWHPDYEKSRVNFLKEDVDSARFAWFKAIMRDMNVSDAGFRLASVLMDEFFNWETGQCNPALSTLARLVEKTPTSVRGTLRSLAKAGWITIVPMKRDDDPSQDTSNQYRLNRIEIKKIERQAKSADNDNNPAKNSSGGYSKKFEGTSQDYLRGGLKNSLPKPTELEPTEKNQERIARETFGDDWPLDAFDQFYRAYPHKVDKQRAREALERQRKAGASFAAIMAGVEAYKSTKPQGQQWLNPASFLDRRRWEDEPASPDVGSKAKPQRRMAI